jgi:hypothetical protein
MRTSACVRVLRKGAQPSGLAAAPNLRRCALPCAPDRVAGRDLGDSAKEIINGASLRVGGKGPRRLALPASRPLAATAALQPFQP